VLLITIASGRFGSDQYLTTFEGVIMTNKQNESWNKNEAAKDNQKGESANQNQQNWEANSQWEAKNKNDSSTDKKTGHQSGTKKK